MANPQAPGSFSTAQAAMNIGAMLVGLLAVLFVWLLSRGNKYEEPAGLCTGGEVRMYGDEESRTLNQ
jgi:hypothetical protein